MELLVVVSGFQLFKKSSSDLQFRNLQYELHKKLVGVGIMVAPLESDGTLNKEMRCSRKRHKNSSSDKVINLCWLLSAESRQAPYNFSSIV